MSDRSNNPPRTYSEIDQHLDTSAFKDLVRGLNIMRRPDVSDEDLAAANISSLEEYWEAQIDRFGSLVNQEIDGYLRNCASRTRENPAKRRRTVINYADRIESMAEELRTLILESPDAISNDEELQSIAEELLKIPRVMRGLRKVDELTGFALDVVDPTPRNERHFRLILIQRIHELYEEFTLRDDWVTSEGEPAIYTNDFFPILRLCYEAAGLEKKDKTIAGDITDVGKLIESGN